MCTDEHLWERKCDVNVQNHVHVSKDAPAACEHAGLAQPSLCVNVVYVCATCDTVCVSPLLTT